jgi:hypothetical protein
MLHMSKAELDLSALIDHLQTGSMIKSKVFTLRSWLRELKLESRKLPAKSNPNIAFSGQRLGFDLALCSS